jgi:predicted RNA polymerase sigma factor
MSLTSKETQILSQLAYLYLMQGYVERASLLYSALHILEPTILHHLRGVALSGSRAGRHDKALAALDQLALRGAVDAPYYSLRARVLADLGRVDEAQAAMRSYLSLRASVRAGSVAKKSGRGSAQTNLTKRA